MGVRACGAAGLSPLRLVCIVPATSVDPPHGEPTAISCSSPTFCTEVDNFGDALIYDGTSWLAPVRVDNSVLGEQYPQVAVDDPSLAIPKADKGKLISVKVTAHRPGYPTGTATSKSVKII